MDYSGRPSQRVLAVAEAKASFADNLRHAEHGDSIIVTRHGVRVAAIVSLEDYEALVRIKAAGPQGGLASLAGGWKGSDELVAAVRSTRRSRPRQAPKLR
jgi:prevent-host-death family protein